MKPQPKLDAVAEKCREAFVMAQGKQRGREYLHEWPWATCLGPRRTKWRKVAKAAAKQLGVML